MSKYLSVIVRTEKGGTSILQLASPQSRGQSNVNGGWGRSMAGMKNSSFGPWCMCLKPLQQLADSVREVGQSLGFRSRPIGVRAPHQLNRSTSEDA